MYYNLSYTLSRGEQTETYTRYVAQPVDSQVGSLSITAIEGWTYVISVAALNDAGTSSETTYSILVSGMLLFPPSHNNILIVLAVPPLVAPYAVEFSALTFIQISGINYATFTASWEMDMYQINSTIHKLEISTDQETWNELVLLNADSSLPENTELTYANDLAYCSAVLQLNTGTTSLPLYSSLTLLSLPLLSLLSSISPLFLFSLHYA